VYEIVSIPTKRQKPKRIAFNCDYCDQDFKVLRPRDKAGKFSGIPERRGTAIAISNRGWKLFERMQRRGQNHH
jgi:hypothetical protein